MILPERDQMLIAGLNFFVGLVCGFRLTLAQFILLMFIALTIDAVLIFSDMALLAAIGHLALAAFCLQAGYVGGVLVRARVG
jgi:hypothetical protein